MTLSSDLSLDLGPAGASDPTDGNPLSGILGSLLGESPSEQKTRLEEATRGARDLTGLVRRRKEETKAPDGPETGNGKGKRKVGFVDDVPVEDERVESKKARVEDA